VEQGPGGTPGQELWDREHGSHSADRPAPGAVLTYQDVPGGVLSTDLPAGTLEAKAFDSRPLTIVEGKDGK
jgi:hypothetical protein